MKIRRKGVRLRQHATGRRPALASDLSTATGCPARGDGRPFRSHGHPRDGGALVTAGCWPAAGGSRPARRAAARKGGAKLPPVTATGQQPRPVTAGCRADRRASCSETARLVRIRPRRRLAPQAPSKKEKVAPRRTATATWDTRNWDRDRNLQERGHQRWLVNRPQAALFAALNLYRSIFTPFKIIRVGVAVRATLPGLVARSG